MSQEDLKDQRAWYILQSIPGLEAAAKRNLERIVKAKGLEDYIFNILIPSKTRQERKKNGEVKEVVERIYPGYIFIDMIVTNDTWFDVRNTPMITGFLGSSGGGAKPVPLEPDEIIPILKECGVTLEIEAKFKVGDVVEVISGTFVGQEATVESIDNENQTVVVLVDFFGRSTPNTLRFDEIKIKE